MKKILVTGGAGFLGSHLCRRLLASGDSVYCVDNFFTGKQENIASLLNHPQFTFIEHDICNPLNLDVDEIYNLACPASPPHYQKDPIFTTRTCVVGSLNLLELAHKNRAKILQASTSEIYGDPKVHPQVESYVGHVNPIGLRSCYDEGKRCAETLFFDYKRKYQLDIKVARIFNTYGPNMQKEDGRVVSNFIVQALNEEPLTIYGKGEQTRSFCYVDDLIEGLILLMNSPHVGPFNLGNPEEYKIQEFADLILKMTRSKSELIYCPLPKDDPKVRCPDISQARRYLNWQPTTLLKDGLDQTIQYFQKILINL